MRKYKTALVIFVAGILICFGIFFVIQISDAENYTQLLSQVLDKEEELEKLLFRENEKLATLIPAHKRPTKLQKKQGQDKPVKDESKIKGNRGFLLKDGCG